MELRIEYILAAVASLFVISVLASKLSVRLGIPALVFFVLIGMLAGSEGPGGIHFDYPWTAQLIGVIALSYILFAAGFETKWGTVRPVLTKGVSLATAGVAVSTGLMAVFANRVLGFPFLEGVLLGAIVSSTDAAAVFSVLRAKGLNLTEKVRSTLELESGSNDPMAVLLALGTIRLITRPQTTAAELLLFFVLQLALGGALGLLFGKATVLAINRSRLEWEGLYPVLSLGLVLLTYGVTASVGGNGFLAVYVAGLVVGNTDFVHRRSLRQFHDGLAWLMQIAMFVVLGLQVFPSQLVPVSGRALAASIFLMFVARPVSVFAALPFGGLRILDRLFISWAGLRGAVPIVLATFPMLAGLERANSIFNIVFFVALTSVVLQGTTVPLVARWTAVQAPAIRRRVFPLEFTPTEGANSELIEVHVRPGSSADGKRIVDLRLPPGALVVLMSRDNQFVVPAGSTVIQADDTVMILAQKETLAAIRAALESSVGPSGPD